MKPFNVCPSCCSVVDASGAYCHRCTQKLESKVWFRACVFIATAILIWVMVAPKSCHGATINASHMHAIAIKESGNNPRAVGKAKELGKFQLKAVAVKEVNRVTGTKWKHSDAIDPELSDYIAYAYMRICQSRAKDKSVASAYRVYRGLK